MKQDFSGWGVIATGGLLALAGVYWLIAGWEHIQIERGWSQFIAGATALSGGVITIAIGRLIRLLVLEPQIMTSAPPAALPPKALKAPAGKLAAPDAEPPQKIARQYRQARPAPPAASRVLSNLEAPALHVNSEPGAGAGAGAGAGVWTETAALPDDSYASLSPSTGAATVSDVNDWSRQDMHEQARQEPTEVDRYTAGDATYVMYSDGSVEVRTPGGARLYESLDALRANSPVK